MALDLTNTLKSELFRPFATLVIPGGVALAPYLIILHEYYPEIDGLWNHSPPLGIALILFVATALGLILENIGSLIEARIWDPRIERDTQCQMADWHRYLQLTLQPEPIGHRYLRTVTIRMKFEVAFGAALLLFWFGVMWLDALRSVLSHTGAIWFSAITLGLAAYLVWESGTSARVLSDVRHVILEKCPCAVVKSSQENPKVASAIDWTLRVSGAAAVFAGVFLGVRIILFRDLRGSFAGGTSAALLTAIGVAFFATGLQDLNGMRRPAAIRAAWACMLACILVVIRLFDRGPHTTGLAAAGAFFTAAVLLRALASHVTSSAR